MQEKATISRLENIVGWIGAILLSISLFLAAFLLAMDCANAEELPIELQEQIIDILDNDLNISVNQTYLNNCFSCPYCAVYNINNGTHNIYYFDFYFTKNIGYLYQRYDGRYYYATYMYFEYTGSNRGYITCSTEYDGTVGTGYRIIVDNTSYYYGSVNATSSNVVQSTNFNITGLPSTYSDIYGYNIYSNSTSSYTYNVLISYGDCYLQNGSTFAVHEDTYTPPPTTSTIGFNVFKYNNLGTDTLRIVPPQNQVPIGTHSSNISTVTFDLVIDGTIIPCEYNSESEYYFESLEYGRAYYEIPLSVLLPSSLNDFDEVYVTNVNYVNTWSNQGGESGTNTFIYVDKCYLKRSIGNDDIGQVSITHIDTDTGYSDAEINNINTMITNASTLQGSFDVEKNLSGGSTTPFSFSSFQDAVVREIECWHPTGTKSSDWLSITIDNITYDSGDNMYWLEYDSNSTQSFEHRYNYNVSPYSYVRENNYSGYYDIIYFIVHEQVYDSSGSGFSTLEQTYTRYYYFISDRYYNKLILYREMDILTYIKLNNEIGEKTYNYLFDRLLNIDDNLYYYIKDKAVIDNDILDALEDIDNDMQFNLDIVVDLLNKILNAILELDIEPTDTTAIENKLDDIYTRLGNSNLNSDWYKRYREWLYDETNDNVLNTPHEYMLNTFDDVKALFDVFAYFDLPQTGFWSSAREYLNRMNGNTYNDNINDYLVTGIGSQNFYKDNCNTLVWSDIE